MRYTLIDGDTELATVETTPFSIELTEAGTQSDVLEEYQNPGDMTEMEGQSSPDGKLTLEEDWVEATQSTIRGRLARVASLNGWSVMPEDEANDA